MVSRKRNLEKMERVAYAPTMDAPTAPRGEAAKYLRDLIARAERGELSKGKGKSATDEKRSKTWLESEVERVAKRIQHRAQTEGANETRDGLRGTYAASNPTSADTEPTDELLDRLLRKTGLASDKVH